MIVLFTSNSNGNKQSIKDPTDQVLFNAMKLQQNVEFFPDTKWNEYCHEKGLGYLKLLRR